jgi:hypothetical protein
MALAHGVEAGREVFMRVAVLALALVVPLSGCGVVGMVASGVSDGTKYVINRFEEGQQAQAGAQDGHDPAGVGSEAAAPNPVPAPPRGDYGAMSGPAPLTAPVTPVTKGVPLN